MARKRKQEIDRGAVFDAILGDLSGIPEVATAGTLPLDEIRFNDQQPRKHFDPVSLDDLAHSIREKGVLEPIIVRRRGDGYEVVAGERRTRAARIAGLSEIPAILVDIGDSEALEIAITENLQREDLNAVEETEAVLGLLEVTLKKKRGAVVELLLALYAEERGRVSSRPVRANEREQTQSVFRRVGRFGISSFVSNRLPILEFPTELLDAVRVGQLEFTKAQALARVPAADLRAELLAEALSENLTLSEIRSRVRELKRRNNVIAGTSDAVRESPQSLLRDTKRLLSAKRLAQLDSSKAARVTQLLRELQELLSK